MCVAGPFDGLLLDPPSPPLLLNHVLLLHALQGAPAFLLPSMLYTTLIIISIKEGKVSKSAPGLCVTTKIVHSTHICPGFTWWFRGFFFSPTSFFQFSLLDTLDQTEGTGIISLPILSSQTVLRG